MPYQRRNTEPADNVDANGVEDYPATGEILSRYALGAYVADGMRGSHQMPLMPVILNSGIQLFRWALRSKRWLGVPHFSVVNHSVRNSSFSLSSDVRALTSHCG